MACATEAHAEAPLDCATHSDELPAGAAAAAASQETTGDEGAGGSLPWLAIAGGMGAPPTG